MRISELFPLIFEHEKTKDAREEKYVIVRTILDEKLADKDDFISIIDNHSNIVVEVAHVLGETQDVIEERLTDIYNYPYIKAAFGERLIEYKPLEESEDEEDYEPNNEPNKDNSIDQTQEEKVINVDIDTDLSKFTKILKWNTILVSVTLALTFFNTLVLFSKPI